MGRHSKYPNVAGIYKITCVDNRKIYIGKSVNINKRLNRHKNCEQKSTGRCYFENVIIKYKWDSFTVEILETFDNFDKLTDNIHLLEKESFYIKLYSSNIKNVGYNTCIYSNDGTGTVRTPHSEESKEKMRQAKLGKKLSKEHVENMRLCRIGKTFSNETKEKMRQSKLGKACSNETREKIRLGNLGKIVSEESKVKMRKPKRKL